MVSSIHGQEMPLVIGVVLAFIGGLLSFGSPSGVSLIPGYLGHLAGTTVAPGIIPSRRAVFGHGISFVFGSVTVFTMAGIAVGQLLARMPAAHGFARWIGGVVIILMGLHTTGLVEIPVLHRAIRMHPRLPALNSDGGHIGLVTRVTSTPIVRDDGRLAAIARRTAGVWLGFGRSSLVGVFFAAGWMPCAGPILAGFYGVVSTQPADGGTLFFAYSLGLGVPFLVVAVLFGRIRGGLWHLHRYHNAISCVGGMFLTGIGILLFTDGFSRLARYAPVINLLGAR